MNPKLAAVELLGDGARRSKGDQARRYNLLAARLMAEIVKSSLGPRGMDKLFVDIMGEVTITKDGATLLRKIDVEHPAAKALVDASNSVDNEVGDGTTSVVVFAGALVRKAEELLDMGISPTAIVDGYSSASDISIKALANISKKCSTSDTPVMKRLVHTCIDSKALGYAGDNTASLIVEAVRSVADLASGRFEKDDIKIEEKEGSIGDAQVVRGIVLDKTIDSSSMPRIVEPARILLLDDDLEGKRTKTDAEIRINSPDLIKLYAGSELSMLRSRIEHIIESGANVVISRKGINTFAQSLLAESGIISIRRVKEEDILWLARATGATITTRLQHAHDKEHAHHHGHHHEHDDGWHYGHEDIDITLGYADRVCEKLVGGDRMVFVEGCRNPKSVTLLLRANSKRTLDECHRSALDAINVLKDFISRPEIVAGGGSVESAIARMVRERASGIDGREQLVVQKFAEALEEIPLTIAKNAGMNTIDTLVQLRSRHASSNGRVSTYGVNAIKRKVDEMFPLVIEPVLVKEQVIKTAVEVVNLLVRVDDVLMARPAMQTHTHDDGTRHSHAGGEKIHQHDHFDMLGKKQRPPHHYY